MNEHHIKIDINKAIKKILNLRKISLYKNDICILRLILRLTIIKPTMKKQILFIFTFLITSIGMLAQEKTSLVEDNFSDNSNNWWIGRSPIGKCEISHGEYVISYKGEKSWSSNIEVNLDPTEDFIIESKISRISGTKENGYGLTWGKGRDGYYNFIVTPKGKFYVRKVQQGQKAKYLINWKSSPYIKENSITNKLRIQKTGQELNFFVNDKYLAKVPFEPFFGNQVGFMLYQEQEVAAEYMIVYGTPKTGDHVIVAGNNKSVEIEKTPDLRIQQIAIKDNQDIENMNSSFGNGNSIIEAGESIELTAFVQNFGLVSAKNVQAKISLEIDDRNVSFPDEYKTFDLGTIESGGYSKFQFFFFTSRRFSADEIPFKIKLEEQAGSYKTEQPLDLKMNERTTNIVDVDVSKLEVKKVADMQQITEVMELSDVDKNIPKSGYDGSNTLAVVIGVEDYKYAPKVDYAKRDAQVFYKYAASLFGVPKQNIYYLSDSEATLGEFNKIFSRDGWLARRTVTDETNIIVYYAGHGAPDIKSETAYLIPYDIDPNYAKTGYSINQLYSSLSALNAKSVTVFLDACFSGKSRNEQMLVSGARAVIIKTESSAFSAKNMSVLTASSNEEYSAAYPAKYHGIFTYYLLKSLQDNAANLDKISVNDFFKGIKAEVVKRAGYLDKEQTPSLIGNDKDRVLLMD